MAAAVPDHDEEHARNIAERVVSAPIMDQGAGAAPPATSTSADLSSKEEPPAVPSTAAATTSATAATPAVLSKPAPVTDEPRQSTASSRPSEESEPKGFRGFFSKLRGKSKAENKLPAESSKTTTTSGTTAAAPAAAIGTTAITTTDAHTSKTTDVVPNQIGTDGPIGASTHTTGARDISPSSFRRHRHRSSSSAADVSSLSSASSSGLDEDNLHSGRTGRMARALRSGQTENTNKIVPDEQAGLPMVKPEVDVVSPNEESDTFEEARDHFDEGLAPQPAFAGQAKSQSPARETRFKEEV